MTYRDFLTRVIEDGIEAAKHDYAESPDKRQGAVEGFEACRGKSPHAIRDLLREARTEARNAHHSDIYWRVRCKEAEIEWVASVISAMALNERHAGRDTLPILVPVTARAVMKAADILGTS